MFGIAWDRRSVLLISNIRAVFVESARLKEVICSTHRTGLLRQLIKSTFVRWKGSLKVGLLSSGTKRPESFEAARAIFIAETTRCAAV